MLVNQSFRSRSFVALGAAMFVAVLGLGVGCSEDALTPDGTTTDFYGMYGDQTGPGTISLSGVSYPTSAPSASLRGSTPGPNTISLSGTLTLAGQAPITLTGYYDPDSTIITYGSDTPFYTFSGNVAGNSAVGVSFGPNGQGSFALLLGGTSANSTTYCGTAVCTTPVDCTATAAFNLVVSGQYAVMTATKDGSSAFGVGSATGSTVNFHIVFGTALDLTIDGTITGSSISGTWADNTASAQAGTWAGDTAQCSSAPAN